MRTLLKLFEHNGWANGRTFDLCQQAANDLFTDAEKGTRGTLDETIKHMVGVEEVYLAMVQGEDVSQDLADRDQYFARDRSWFLGRGRELPGEYWPCSTRRIRLGWTARCGCRGSTSP